MCTTTLPSVVSLSPHPPASAGVMDPPVTSNPASVAAASLLRRFFTLSPSLEKMR